MSTLKRRKKPYVLYFTPESNLTERQAAEIDAIPGARHRNAALVQPDEPLEKGVTGVAGPAVPPSYQHFPYVEAEEDIVAELLGEAEQDDGQDSEVEEEEEEEQESSDDPGTDFEAMTPAQLKTALTAKGVEFPASARKAALVALAQQHLVESEE